MKSRDDSHKNVNMNWGEDLQKNKHTSFGYELQKNEYTKYCDGLQKNVHLNYREILENKVPVRFGEGLHKNTYRITHKSLRDFRPLRYSSRDGHAEGEHVNRGRGTPSFCPTLQVLDMPTLGDAAGT